jgi:hypothetical protein
MEESMVACSSGVGTVAALIFWATLSIYVLYQPVKFFMWTQRSYVRSQSSYVRSQSSYVRSQSSYVRSQSSYVRSQSSV